MSDEVLHSVIWNEGLQLVMLFAGRSQVFRRRGAFDERFLSVIFDEVLLSVIAEASLHSWMRDDVLQPAAAAAAAWVTFCAPEMAGTNTSYLRRASGSAISRQAHPCTHTCARPQQCLSPCCRVGAVTW